MTCELTPEVVTSLSDAFLDLGWAFIFAGLLIGFVTSPFAFALARFLYRMIRSRFGGPALHTYYEDWL